MGAVQEDRDSLLGDDGLIRVVAILVVEKGETAVNLECNRQSYLRPLGSLQAYHEDDITAKAVKPPIGSIRDLNR